MSGPDDMLRLKTHCMANGIRLSPSAVAALSADGTQPLTVHEYATTGGVTLRMGDVHLNAPFDEWYVERSRAELVTHEGGFAVELDGRRVPCEVLPLPGYLDAVNRLGQPVTRTTMSHLDRIRVSPISGCTLDCHFCDLPALRYTRYEAEELLASIDVAKADTALPPHHLLISGGSPGPAHFEWFDTTVVEVIQGSGLPTDVMMSPREGDLDWVDRYVDAGVNGFSFNLEVHGDDYATRFMPRKHRRSSPHLPRTVEAAVDRLGPGRVRSIVIVGLEPFDSTIEAIELIAGLGADPVLSPFRPAMNTRLEKAEPPTEAFLLDVHAAALEIARRNGVRLGPRCIPCQHNTLVLPDDSGDYWYSATHDHAAQGV